MKLGNVASSFRLGNTTPSRIYLGSTLVWQSGFTPLSLSPALWLSDTGTNPAQWDDNSGNNRHAVRATTANQPAIVSAALNGRQVRRFDGSALLVIPQVTNTPFSGSVYCVSSRSAIQVTGTTYQKLLTSWTGLGSDDIDPSIRLFAEHLKSGGSPVGYAPKITYRTGSMVLWNARVGCDASNNSENRFSGDIAEILVFPTALSTENHRQVVNYLSAKWNMPILSDGEFLIQGLTPALWLDAADASTLYDGITGGALVGSDGVVARINDKSGNNRHLTQATFANRPQRKTSVFNGKDIIRFFGGGDIMNITGFSITNPMTVFAVMYLSADSGGYRIALAFGNNVVAMGYTNTGSFFGATMSVARPRPTSLEILRLISNGASSSISANGVETTGSTGNHSTTTFAFPSNGVGNTYQADIAEILVFPTALSDTNRQAVENHLNAKWAIY